MDRQAGALPSIAWTVQSLKVLRVAAAAHCNRNDVVELQLRLSAAMHAPPTIPHPHQLLDVVGDYISAPGLVLGLHAQGNHDLRPLIPASLTILLCYMRRMHLTGVKVVPDPIEPILKFQYVRSPIFASRSG
jgi:hypothetical protein